MLHLACSKPQQLGYAAEPLHPEKVKYYLERRDPDFESKMRQVLLVYREVAWQNESPREGGPSPGVITVSVDEKPGVQAIANVAPDLPPVPGRHPCVARDKRLGTCSILDSNRWPLKQSLRNQGVRGHERQRPQDAHLRAADRDLSAKVPATAGRLRILRMVIIEPGGAVEATTIRLPRPVALVGRTVSAALAQRARAAAAMINRWSTGLL